LADSARRVSPARGRFAVTDRVRMLPPELPEGLKGVELWVVVVFRVSLTNTAPLLDTAL
jgi:hypothetical protein